MGELSGGCGSSVGIRHEAAAVQSVGEYAASSCVVVTAACFLGCIYLRMHTAAASRVI